MPVTKFHLPSVHQNLLQRSHLIQELNAGLCQKMTLVSAPAGFGKSSLVVDWFAHHMPEDYENRAAWLSLDENDNTLVPFWQCVISALKIVAPSFCRVCEASLKNSHALPMMAIVNMVINEIAAEQRPMILGLDDYHRIENAEIHASLAYFITHLPSNFHLVIITREDPPISLSRLRIHRELTELRANELRFQEEESAAFFNQLLSLALTSEDIKALNARTEGWIAGLQLAALSLNETEDKTGFVQAFTGSNRFLTDYLVDEVLSRQTSAIKKFLYRTSVLELFCADLCDELVEGVDSRRILRQLEQANLFIIPLDDDRHWFRFHHLFKEFLYIHLVEHESEKITDLHRSAAEWFAKAGLLQEALNHAFQAEEFEQAAVLIERLAPQVLRDDNHMLLIQWIDLLPDDQVNQRPFLCVYLSWAWVIAGQMENACSWLEAAEENCDRITKQESQVIRGHVSAHRAYIVFLQGEHEWTIEYAQRALELLPDDETALRARALTCLGNAYNYCGQLHDAKSSFQEAIRIAKKIESLPLALFSYCSLGEVYRDEGRLKDALDAYQQLLKFAEKLAGRQDIPLTGFAQFEVGVLLRERLELDAAIQKIEMGVGLCREWQQGEALGIGLLELAETYRLRGDFSLAATAIEEAQGVAEVISPWAVNLVSGFATRLALSQGDIEAARKWVLKFDYTAEDFDLGYGRISECLALMQSLIAIGRSEQALVLAKRMIERDRAVGRMGRVLDMLVLQAAALSEIGERKKAAIVLSEAVEISSSEKIIRPFLDEGQRLIPYLKDLPISAHRDLLLTLLCGDEEHNTRSVNDDKILVEPLIEREIAILRMMSVGRSNREIGDELFLSVNTIRWYASQIYSKMGVRNRGEAVAQARELGLI